MPNQTSIGIVVLQYQSHCLDVDEIARWNQRSWRMPIHVWMSIQWYLRNPTPRRRRTPSSSGRSSPAPPTPRRRSTPSSSEAARHASPEKDAVFVQGGAPSRRPRLAGEGRRLHPEWSSCAPPTPRRSRGCRP